MECVQASLECLSLLFGFRGDFSMARLLLAGLLLIVAGSGCRMCSNCYDYASPVMDCPCGGPYARVGSVADSSYDSAPPSPDEVVLPIPQELPAEEEEPAKEETALLLEPPAVGHNDD